MQPESGEESPLLLLKRKREASSDDELEATVAKKNPKPLDTELKTNTDRAGDIADDSLGLSTLLDFATVTSHAEIDLRFQKIASLLLQDYQLVVSSSATSQVTFEVLELEFYLIKPGCHEDPFTHGSEEQRQSARWYFHRAPRSGTAILSSQVSREPSVAGGYRGGSRKGLDLTFGGPIAVASRHFSQVEASTSSRSDIPAVVTSAASTDPPRGGILLRSLRRVSDNKVISGPSLLVDEILRLSKATNIADLVNAKWNGNTAAFRAQESAGPTNSAPHERVSLYLKPRDIRDTPAAKSGLGFYFKSKGSEGQNSKVTKPRVYRSPRIGLDLSNSEIPIMVEEALKHPRAVFVSKAYRYFTHPHLLTANGRGQTFLGVYIDDLQPVEGSDVVGLAARRAPLSDVMRKTGLKEATAQKYMQDYLDGYESGMLKGFIGAEGKGASSSPPSFLKMMGALKKLQEDQDT